MEPFIGQIIMFGGNFAPRGWAFCNGQLLPIAQHSALFSLLGTTYGGDGVRTFGLPDLRGRVPMHFGDGPGLARRELGEKGGIERNMPPETTAEKGAADPVEVTGKQTSEENLPPYQCVNFVIALQGIYPSRS